MSEEVKGYYVQFGNYAFYIAITIIASIGLSFIPQMSTALTVLEFVLFILVLTYVKKISERIHNPVMEDFYSKLLVGVILLILGNILLSIYSSISAPFFNFQSASTLISFAPIAAGGLILLFLGAIFQRIAWESAETFFALNDKTFPGTIGQEAAHGAHDLKTAMLMFILFFLVITLIIGFIMQIIGYFRLGSALRKLRVYQAEEFQAQTVQPSSQTPKQPGFTQDYQETTESDSNLEQEQSGGKAFPKFCAKCGQRLMPGEKFCTRCGTRIDVAVS